MARKDGPFGAEEENTRTLTSDVSALLWPLSLV